MKKIYLNFITAVLVVVGVVGCSSDSLLMNGDNQVKANEVVASVEGQGSTRVAVIDAASKSLVWTSGDQISVFNESGVSGTLNLNNECANLPSGIFGGDLDADFGTMVSSAYPSANTSLSGTTLTMSIPATIPLADAVTVDGTNAYKFPLPMYGKFDGNKVQFKFLTGMLKLVLSNLPVNTEKVIIKADKPISGTFTASTDAQEPILASTSNEASDKVITVTFDKLTEPHGKVIYIPLPAQDYGSILVQYAGKYDGSTETATDLVSWTGKTVERRMIYTASYGLVAEVDATSPSGVSTAIESIIQSAESGFPVHIELTGAVTARSEDKTITIPTKNAAGDAVDVSMTFETVPTIPSEGELVFKTDEADSSPTTATNKISISVPESSEGINLNIDAPTSTVTLQSASGTTDNTKTYREVVARTAFNTLIVDNDARVNNAEVQDGTVQVKRRGILESWTFTAENNGDQVVVKADGGIMPSMTTIGTDEDGNPISLWLISSEDGEPYYAYSLKVAKGAADYSVVWFAGQDERSVLKTVVIGEDAALQTNWIAMENIVGEGEGEHKARINYVFTNAPTAYTDEQRFNIESRDKYYEYNSDMCGVKSVKNVVFSQPVIDLEDWYVPIHQDSISKGYKMHEPRLNLDLDGVLEDCTFEYNHVYLCNEHSFGCPTVKNCNFVHVDREERTSISGYEVIPIDYDEVDMLIPYNPEWESNEITFDNCDFSANTKFAAFITSSDPNSILYREHNDPINYTVYINFKNCTIGGVAVNETNFANYIKNLGLNSDDNMKYIIRFDDTNQYNITIGPGGFTLSPVS